MSGMTDESRRRLAAQFKPDPAMERLAKAASMTPHQRMALGHYLEQKKAYEAEHQGDET